MNLRTAVAEDIKIMGIIYADLRLANQARPDLEEINASAVVDTEALHLCIPEHVAVQLQLNSLKRREVQTADGKSHLVDYVAPIRISMLGREVTNGQQPKTGNTCGFRK